MIMTASSVKLEESLLMNKSNKLAIKEKDDALKMASKELEKNRQKERVMFQKELQKSQMTAAASSAKPKGSLLMNKSNTLAINKKDDALKMVSESNPSVPKENENFVAKICLQKDIDKGLDKKKGPDDIRLNNKTTEEKKESENRRQEYCCNAAYELEIVQDGLKFAQEAVVSIEARFEQEMNNYQTTASSIKEKDDSFAFLELKTNEFKKKLNNSKKEYLIASNLIKQLLENNMRLGKIRKDKEIALHCVAESKLQSEKVYKKELDYLQKKLKIAQAEVVSITAQLEEEKHAKIPQILENSEILECKLQKMVNYISFESEKLMRTISLRDKEANEHSGEIAAKNVFRKDPA